MRYVWMSHVTHVTSRISIYEWVMSHMWQVAYLYTNESCHTCDKLYIYIRMSHVTHLTSLISIYDHTTRPTRHMCDMTHPHSFTRITWSIYGCPRALCVRNVWRDSSHVCRDSSHVGRDSSHVGRDSSHVGRDSSHVWHDSLLFRVPTRTIHLDSYVWRDSSHVSRDSFTRVTWLIYTYRVRTRTVRSDYVTWLTMRVTWLVTHVTWLIYIEGVHAHCSFGFVFVTWLFVWIHICDMTIRVDSYVWRDSSHVWRGSFTSVTWLIYIQSADAVATVSRID